ARAAVGRARARSGCRAQPADAEGRDPKPPSAALRLRFPHPLHLCRRGMRGPDSRSGHSFRTPNLPLLESRQKIMRHENTITDSPEIRLASRGLTLPARPPEPIGRLRNEVRDGRLI